jgi:hypothetical protein
MGSSQKRAIKNYQSRLSETGRAHFEVLGITADGDLIRSFAHQCDPRKAQRRIAPRCVCRLLSLPGDLSLVACSAGAQ